MAGAAPPHNVVLIGPRGNGKTALLGWFKSACGQADRRVDVVALTPPDVPTEARLINALAPRRLAKWLPRKRSAWRPSVRRSGSATIPGRRVSRGYWKRDAAEGPAPF